MQIDSIENHKSHNHWKTLRGTSFNSDAHCVALVSFILPCWSRHAMRFSIANRFTILTQFWRDARINWISFTIVFKRIGILEYSKQHDEYKKGIWYICCSASIIERTKIKQLWQLCSKIVTDVAIFSYEL